MSTPSVPNFQFGPLSGALLEAGERWRALDGTRRLFEADASLFTNTGEDRWLGWIEASNASRADLASWNALASELHSEGITDAVIMGMGGSSLCPDVLQKTFGPRPGYPRLRVLDSTVPSQIRRIEEAIALPRTLFVVPSKSGSTLEPEALARHFMEATARELGPTDRGSHFVAITDPGSDLEANARRDGFRLIALGVPEIGGRFSALSVFGMLPAALLGLDVTDFLDRADAMRAASRIGPAVESNPAVSLGVALGEAARQGRDKLTLVLSPGIAALGSWLEQLIAESTGKSGQGIIPIDGEGLARPEHYEKDRVFLQLRLDSELDDAEDRALQELATAGHPVIQTHVAEKADLAAEFFRFEVATAVAGAVLGVNPFDQPDVEAAKKAARERMEHPPPEGRPPRTGSPLLETGGMAVYADSELAIPEGTGLGDVLVAHFARLRPGDYLAFNAFLDMDDRTVSRLEELRKTALDALGVATTLGFGPRFLHSTGQLHKGGPPTGLFIVLTANDPVEVTIPGLPFDFSTLKQAQAEGDFQVLCERGRRAIRVHLDDGSSRGLDAFVSVARRAIEDAKIQSKGESP